VSPFARLRQVPPAATAAARLINQFPTRNHNTEAMFFVVAHYADRKISYTRSLPGALELAESLFSTGAKRVEIEREWS
jgi:hypothetical protein